MVTQPSFASRFALALTRLSCFPSSSVGPSITSKASPTSSIRIAFPWLMSKLVVMATDDLHTSSLASSKLALMPTSFKVAQPTLLSLLALPRIRCISCDPSCFGPWIVSTTSPGFMTPTSSENLSKLSVMDVSSWQAEYGFGTHSRKTVPWLPRRVTQPSRLSNKARQRTRATPIVSLTRPASRTSTTSSGSIFLNVLLSFTSEVFVMAISLTHFQ
mmetsp:Transcript_17779/g.47960  ORF Transcript_17779/g.47960 Transcript_17779/m.47960 type:complete len:216 (-) Transcript_17779:5024-5671(-)